MPTNNTASLKRTEPAWLARVVGSTHAPTVIAAILLTIVFISFRPFQPQGAALDPDAGGDIVNQLGFSMVGGLALFSLVTYANPRVVSIFFSPWWLAMLGCFAFSITHALDPAATARAGLFTLIGLHNNFWNAMSLLDLSLCSIGFVFQRIVAAQLRIVNLRKALRVIPRGKRRLTVYRAHQSIELTDFKQSLFDS